MVLFAGTLRPTDRQLRPTDRQLRASGRGQSHGALGVGIGAVDEDNIGNGGGVARHDPRADLVERQPRAVDIAGHHHHRRHRRRPSDVAGGAHVPSGQRVDKRALAGAGAADDADDKDARELAAGPVEPRSNLLPLRPHAAGRGPVGERTAPSREPRDEVVESGVVKSGRRRRGDDGRSVIRAKRGHVGHLENSRPQS